PVTSLSMGAPQYAASGAVYVSTLTPFALTAQDPVVVDVASGVRNVLVAQSSGAFSTYAGTFTLTAPDGMKTPFWFATDNVGNQEVTQSTAVVLDSTPPLSSLVIEGGRQFVGP